MIVSNKDQCTLPGQLPGPWKTQTQSEGQLGRPGWRPCQDCFSLHTSEGALTTFQGVGGMESAWAIFHTATAKDAVQSCGWKVVPQGWWDSLQVPPGSGGFKSLLADTLCKVAQTSGTVPMEWQTGVVAQRVCSKSRGITLLILPRKLYARVLERRAICLSKLGFKSNNAVFIQVMEQWTSSIFLQRWWRGHENL